MKIVAIQNFRILKQMNDTFNAPLKTIFLPSQYFYLESALSKDFFNLSILILQNITERINVLFEKTNSLEICS